MVFRVVTGFSRQSLNRFDFSILCYEGIYLFGLFFEPIIEERMILLKVKRVFNNNVVLAYQGNSEIVIFGKGVGYQKQRGDEVEKKLIEKVFTLTEKETNHFEELFKEISSEYTDLTFRIIKQAESDLQIEFDSSIYLSIMDHINYAIIRAKKGLHVRNELIWEIKRTYKKEYEAALNTLEIIKRETGMQLEADEAGIIAIHYFNAQDPKKNIKANYKAVEVIQDIVKIIQFHFRVEFDENELSFSRLMTHLRYFINSLVSNEKRKNEMDDEFMYCQMKKKYTDTYECVMKINKYIVEKLEKEVSDEEALYLMMHIQRIVEKAKSGE